MRLRHTVASVAIFVCAALGVPAAASAAAVSPIPWQPYRTSPFNDAPGAVCSFGVAATIVADQEQTRILSSYPDGDPKLQEFRGPLFIRYTNTSTGASVVRDLSGYGWFHYLPDGGTDAFAASHLGVTVPVGNTGFPAGEWVISGQFEVIFSSSGAISARLFHATAENMCDTLS